MLASYMIERVRQLPYNGEIVVKIGDWVDETQVVAKIDYIPGSMRRVDVGRPLGVSAQALRQYLMLREGDPVQVGQALAVHSCFGERRVVPSPWSGYVSLISRSLGHVYVREPIPVGRYEPLIIDVAKQLAVPPLLIGNYLRVRQGSVVVPEQVIARRRLGWREQFVFSTIYGKVVDIAGGQVTIAPLHVHTELPAYIAGRVISVNPGLGVTLRAYACVISGNYGVGKETGGLLHLAGDAGVDLAITDVRPSWKGKVVVGGGSANLAVLQAAAQVGVHALVLASLPLQVLQDYSQNRTIGLTGDEDLPLTVVLTEGFLPVAMAERTWSTLAELQGRYASVNGTTHIRAGVIRPEVVVCERDWPPGLPLQPQPDSLRIGARVRVTSGRRAGCSGMVVDLPPEPQTIATGSRVRVAIVQADTEQLTIPVHNLELWGE